MSKDNPISILENLQCAKKKLFHAKEEKHKNLAKRSDFILFFKFNEKRQEKCMHFELIRLKIDL